MNHVDDCVFELLEVAGHATNGNYEYTFSPSVVFGTDTKHVITSIPSTNPTC